MPNNQYANVCTIFLKISKKHGCENGNDWNQVWAILSREFIKRQLVFQPPCGGELMCKPQVFAALHCECKKIKLPLLCESCRCCLKK